MELNQNINKDSIEYKVAYKKVKALKGFYGHLAIYLIINISLLFVYSLGKGWAETLLDPANYITAMFWGIGLLAHAASVFLPNFVFGKNWEERKIKKLMEREKSSTWE